MKEGSKYIVNEDGERVLIGRTDYEPEQTEDEQQEIDDELQK